MNIAEGFSIEQPDLFVPWNISEAELRRIFTGNRLCEVTRGYFTTSCVSLGGLSHELGFHFHPRAGGVLLELEFFRRAYPDQAASYHEFQRHLESTFGKPTTTTPGSEGFPTHAWKLPRVRIGHYIFDRFGPEEHVRIEHT